MNKPDKVMVPPTKPVDETTEPTGSDVAIKPNRISAAALMNVAITLGSAVLLAAMSGPKLPKATGE